MNFREELNKRREAAAKRLKIINEAERFLADFLMALAVEPNFLEIKYLTFDILKKGYLTALETGSECSILSVYFEDDAKEILEYLAENYCKKDLMSICNPTSNLSLLKFDLTQNSSTSLVELFPLLY